MVRCDQEVGCEIKAIAYIYKTNYCEIESLEGADCKCPGSELPDLGLCVVAESTIRQDFGEWREISVNDFQFEPQLRLYDIQMNTNGELFGVYTSKTFRNVRWARWVCYEGPDDDEIQFELEDCGPGQARQVSQ